MINIQALFKAYTQLKQNPSQFLGIPQQYTNSPDDAIQYLMNNGKISQEAYNAANNQIKQLQNNPMFKQYFK